MRDREDKLEQQRFRLNTRKTLHLEGQQASEWVAKIQTIVTQFSLLSITIV